MYRRNRMLVLLWLSLTIASAISGAAILNVRKFYLLSKRGTLTEGQVTKTEAQNHQSVYYSYSIDQRSYSGGGDAGDINRSFDEVAVGDKVPVTYDSLSPASSCLGNPDEELRSLMHGVVFISLFPTFGFISYFVKKEIRGNTKHPESTA